MEKKEYQTLYSVEDDYWWYRGLRSLVSSSIDRFRTPGEKFQLLDAGCGTGGFLSRCNQDFSFGFDFSDEALRFCQSRKIKNLARASITAVPFKDNSFDVLCSLDVLYYAKQDEAKSLSEF